MGIDVVSRSGLPGSGFYPEISGIFRAVGIFLGNFFRGKNLGKILGVFLGNLQKTPKRKLSAINQNNV